MCYREAWSQPGALTAMLNWYRALHLSEGQFPATPLVTVPTLILWGENDIFFTPEGGRAYLRDLPDAELHMLDSGHFAVEDSLDEIVAQIKRFHAENVDGRTAAQSIATAGSTR